VVVVGAEAVEAVEVAAAVEAVEAAVVAAGVEAAVGVEAFGSTAAAVAAWRVRDVQWAGGAFRRRHLRISIRHRRQADRL